jgi:hypothetical protein
MAARLNGRWHLSHPMPKNATLDQRVTWHLAHAKACGCREIPGTVAAELRRRGMSVTTVRKGARSRR